MFDLLYSDKAGGTNFGTNGRFTLTNMGGIIRLDGDNNEEAAIHVQHNWQHNSQDHIENRIDLLVSHTTMEKPTSTI